MPVVGAVYDTVGFYPYDSLKGYSQGIDLILLKDSVLVDELWVDYHGPLSIKYGKYCIMKTFTVDGEKHLEYWHYHYGALVKITYYKWLKDQGNEVSYGRIGRMKF